MRHRYWLLALIPVVLALAWLAVPREYLPDFLRRAGKFRGPHDNAPRPTANWVEALRNGADLQERRDAAYALAIVSSDYGLDREAQDVLPVLLAGMKDRDEWIRHGPRRLPRGRGYLSRRGGAGAPEGDNKMS